MNQENSAPRGDRRALVLIVAGAYAVAFLYIFFFDHSIFGDRGYPIHNGGDSGEYATLAMNIAEYGTFSLTLDPPRPEMFRSPGYPLFLAPLYLLGHSFMLAIFVQALLVVGSALLIYLIGASFLQRPWPTVAALVYALDPTTIFYSLSLWSDGLFVFLILLAVYLLLVRPPGVWVTGLAGLAVGYATLVRSAGSYLLFILAFFFLAATVQKVGFKKTVTALAVFLVACGMVLAPWYARNYHESGVVGLSTTGPYTLLMYHVRDFEIKKGVSAAEFDREVFSGLGVVDSLTLRDIRHASNMMQVVKERITADPVRYAVYHTLGSINFFLSSSIRDATINLPVLAHGLSSLGFIGGNEVSVKSLLTENPFKALRYATFAEPLLTLERLFRFIIVVLALIGVLGLLARRRMTALVALCITIIMYTALIIGPVSYPRYRMPAEPFLLLVAATGASLLLRAKMEV